MTELLCGDVLTVCVVCPLRAMVVTRVTPDSAPPRQVNIGAGAWSRPWSGPWSPRQVNITGANGANQPSQDIAPRSRPWSLVRGRVLHNVRIGKDTHLLLKILINKNLVVKYP